MNIKQAFSTFAVKDLAAAENFYRRTLGIKAKVDDTMGIMQLEFAGGLRVSVYPKPDHKAASFTVLNLVVEDIDAAVDELIGKQVKFEHYQGFGQDEKGIARSTDPAKGPSIAWFKDPFGNIISVLEDSP